MPNQFAKAFGDALTWHHVCHNLPTSFANLLEAQFCDFGKNPRMPSSFAKPK